MLPDAHTLHLQYQIASQGPRNYSLASTIVQSRQFVIVAIGWLPPACVIWGAPAVFQCWDTQQCSATCRGRASTLGRSAPFLLPDNLGRWEPSAGPVFCLQGNMNLTADNLMDCRCQSQCTLLETQSTSRPHIQAVPAPKQAALLCLDGPRGPAVFAQAGSQEPRCRHEAHSIVASAGTATVLS